MDIQLDVIKKKLNSLREDKAAGDDNLSPRILKAISDEIAYPVAMIFRRSLDTGCVPRDWRTANVTPIFKKGSRHHAGNYRPVSLTSQICKVVESIIRDELGRSVLVGAEVFSMVHQVTDALLQVTNQSRDDAVARERLLLQQQQLLQRDFVEKEIKERELQTEKEIKEKQLQTEKEIKERQLQTEKEVKERQILADKETKQMEKEVKEKEIQLEREKLVAVAAEKEKKLLTEREMQEKQLLVSKELQQKQMSTYRELKEKQKQLEREQLAAVASEKEKLLQFEREKKPADAAELEKQRQLELEKMVAETIDKERQAQFERDKLAAEATQKERQMQALEKQKLIEAAEKEKENMKREFEEKLELRVQLAEEKQRRVTGLEERRSLDAQQGVPCTPTLVKGLSMNDTQMEMNRSIEALVENLPVLPSFAGTPHQHNTNTQATPLSTINSDLVSLPSTSLTYTPTYTNETALAQHLHWPTPTTLPCVHAEPNTDLHLQTPKHNITGLDDVQVSMKLASEQYTLAPSPMPSHSVVGRTTTTSSHDKSDKQTGLMSTTAKQSAPVMSTNISPHTVSGDGNNGDKSEAPRDIMGPNAPLPPAATSVKGNATPVSPIVSGQPSVVVVRQFQKVKPYTGQTSHKSFKEHFERVAKANAWSTEEEKMQHLALALEGPALECLREVKEEETGAYEKLWLVLARRFGHLDEPERAMRRFEARKQLDGESVAEYEQALRTLYREAWPKADESTKDAALKRRFEDGISSPDMLQFLRLHARQDDFLSTVAKARRFAEAQEAARPKKAVRIVEDKEKDHGDDVTRSGQPDFQPLIDGFGKVLQTVLSQNQNPAMVTVGVRDENRSEPTGKYSVSSKKERQDQARREQQPQQLGGKSGTERARGNTPERESRRGRNGNGNGNDNRYPRRTGSVSPGRDDYRQSGQRVGRANGRGNGNDRGYYRASSADSYRSGASSGQRPGNFVGRGPGSRYFDESYQRYAIPT